MKRTSSRGQFWSGKLLSRPRRRASRPELEALEDRITPAAVPFLAQPPITTNAEDAVSVATGDLNGDGRLDVVSASFDDDKIAWYENDGAASSFTEHTISTSADGASAVAVADLDGDGDLDVISASYLDDKIAWYENDGAATPSFTEHLISSTANGAQSLAVGDINGDGKLDVVAISRVDHTVAWYENNGAAVPSFTPHTISTDFTVPFEVAVGDLNGDGHLDVLASSFGKRSLTWFENDGAAVPSFTLHTISTSTSGEQDVAVGDINGDGHLDVLSVSLIKNAVYWYENDGAASPSFTQHTITTNARSADSVSVADLDGDGDPDVLAVSIYGGHKILWYENDGAASPSFTEHVVSSPAPGAGPAVAADLDGDGDLDVLAPSSTDNTVNWYRNDMVHRSATFPEQSPVSTGGQNAFSVVAGDINGDGHIDLLSSSPGAGTIAWYPGLGDGTFLEEPPISNTAGGVRGVALGDLNGDGHLDVVAASFDDNQVVWYENGGGLLPSFTEHAVGSGGGPVGVAVADLDGDGDLDIVTSFYNDGAVVWYENSGDGSFFTPHILGAGLLGADSVAVADLDGDGRPDVVAAASLESKIVWYHNNGDSSFTREAISDSAAGARSVAVADVNGDGKPDVLAATFDDSTVSWYENDGAANPSFTQHTISNSVAGAQSVSVADLDGDGDADVLAASYSGGKTVWLENTAGDGSTFTTHTVAVKDNGALSVAAADFNGDGRLDVVSGFNDGITFSANQGGQFALSAPDETEKHVAGGREVVLTFTLTHQGRAGDNAVQLTEFDPHYTHTSGDPLTPQEINNVFESFSVYRDSNGDGVFEADVDTRYLLTNLFFGDGDHQRLLFAGDDPVGRVEVGTPGTFFFVVQLTDDAAQQATHDFRVSIPAAGVVATDTLGTPLTMEGASAGPASLIHAINPALAATGTDSGDGVVHVYDAVSGVELAHFTAYTQPHYSGGARVALGDVTGDGVPDLIVAPGKGLPGGALVKVYDGAALLNGMATELFELHPYGTVYSGEVFVAAGRFNGDALADIVTSNAAQGPLVKVFDAATLGMGDDATVLGSCRPFGKVYKGGARLAAGDVNGDGTTDIIAGQSKNGSQVVAISGGDFKKVLLKKTVSPTAIKGGVFVAAGSLDGVAREEIIVGLGTGAKSVVQVYADGSDADTKATLLGKSTPVYGSTFKGGVRVAAADLDGDGKAEVFTTAGSGLADYRPRVLDGRTLAALDAYFSQAPDFADALFLAAARLG